MRPDYIALHHQFKTRHTGQTRAEYASPIQKFRRPRRQVGPFLVTAVVLLGTLFMVRM